MPLPNSSTPDSAFGVARRPAPPGRIDGARLAAPGGGEPCALALDGGRLVGMDPAGAGPDHAVAWRIDATGLWVLPGFVDPHVHLTMAARARAEADLSAADSRAAFEAVIAAAAAAAPAGDDWIRARGWDESRWGGARPNAAWLAAAGDRPALAWRMDIHAAVVNAAGLARLDLRDPVPGGTIVRDDDGRPTGLLLEGTAWTRLLPVLPPPDPARDREAVRAAVAHAHSRGLVGLGSMETLDDAEAVLEPLAGELSLPIRVIALEAEVPGDVDRLRRLGRGHPALRGIGVKAFLDGTLGSRTARLLAPYSDAADDVGLWCGRAADGTLEAWARSAAGAGVMLAMHAIGDAAVRAALDAADVAAAVDPSVAVRIEHAQHVAAEDIPRFVGRLASMQPAHRIGDRGIMDERLGPVRARAAFPFRRLAAAGATLAFGSDWPVVDCDPLAAIAAAVAGVTRDGAQPDGEEIDVAAALAAHAEAAWTAIDEAGRGRLVAGAPADLVLVDRDPFAVDWSRERPRVVVTVADGHVVHEA